MPQPANRPSPPGAPPAVEEQILDSETPKGTLFILLFFAAAIVIFWGYAYMKLVLRG